LDVSKILQAMTTLWGTKCGEGCRFSYLGVKSWRKYVNNTFFLSLLNFVSVPADKLTGTNGWGK
jgi:hypothetical protein